MECCAKSKKTVGLETYIKEIEVLNFTWCPSVIVVVIVVVVVIVGISVVSCCCGVSSGDHHVDTDVQHSHETKLKRVRSTGFKRRRKQNKPSP